MVLEILKTLFILAIAIPFVYIITASIFDLVKKMYGFFKMKTKPVLIKVDDRKDKYSR